MKSLLAMKNPDTFKKDTDLLYTILLQLYDCKLKIKNLFD
jgi:hypothetical protein